MGFSMTELNFRSHTRKGEHDPLPADLALVTDSQTLVWKYRGC